MDSSIDLLNFSLEAIDISSINSSHESHSSVTESDPKTQGSENSKSSVVDRIISHYTTHCYSLRCLEGIMELMNVGREMCDKLPEKKKRILKMFWNHRDLFDVLYFVKCDLCKKTIRMKSDNADQEKCCDKILKKTETNFFVYLPIEKQLCKSIENNWVHIQSFLEDFDPNIEIESYSDARDGEILRAILKEFNGTDIKILSLCLNVDGANKYKSNKFSLWPIQFTQNFLPPEIRFKTENIIVAGLFYTDSGAKLNFRDYLLPLANEMNHLKNEPITLFIDEEDYMFKPVITHCAIDLPAKSKIQETKQFGGYNACSFCKIRGELVPVTTSKAKKGKKQQNKVQKEPKNCVRYLEGEYDHPLRDETETLTKMLKASFSSQKQSTDGIKDISCLVAFDEFNIVTSFSVEYMHCVLLGDTKRILNLFLETTNSHRPFYILPKKKKLLNSRIVSIKPNADVVRKPRSLEQISDFKASEFRFMLLYYLPVCLEGCLQKVYVEHIRLLSGAVYLLLKKTVSRAEVDEAEEMLEKFVKQHQQLFGADNMVMNVHLLKHLVQSVRKLGPLWCHSAFPFERNNGILLKLVSGTTDVLLQISSKYCLKKSLIKKCRETEKKSVTDDTILLGKSEAIVLKAMRVVNIESLEEVDLSNKELCVHKRIKLGNTIYTSLMYERPKKSIDYFVALKNDFIGMAKFYVTLNSKIFVVLEEYEDIDSIHHIYKVQRTNRNILASIDNIVMKYIYMKVGIHQHITSTPNPYEKE